ncbi:MAG: SHOCT domain-containing protein [Acidimicrobiia bacterium]
MLRRGRPLLRTAAVVGTATVVSGSVAHHQQQKYANQDAEAQEVQYAAPPPAAAPAEPDMNAELTQLAELHNQGILTDEEFAAKKAQILGI